MTETEAAESRTAWWDDRRVLWITVGLVLVPLVVLAIRVLVDGRIAPGGDQALMELRVRDVGTSHTPLVGSYQRFGFNQPGPWIYYLLAVPYRALGSDYAGLQVGAVAINALAVVAVAWVAFRRGGGLLLLWTFALLGLVAHSLGPIVLSDPWEPSLTVLLLVALVFVVTDLASGRAWSFPLAAAIATLLAQYVTVAPLAAVILLWGAVAFAGGWFAPRGPDGKPARGPWKRPAIAGAAILAVLWLPPVIEELKEDPGNITLMWRFFTKSHEALGLGDAYRAVSIQLGPKPTWAGFELPRVVFQPIVDVGAAPLVPIALLALVAGAAYAIVRRDRTSLALAATVGVALATGILSLSRLIGGVFNYLELPAWVFGFGCWLAAVAPLLARLRDGARSRLAGLVPAVLALVVVGFCAVNSVQAATDDMARPRIQSAAAELAQRAVPVAKRAHGPVLVASAVKSSSVLLGTIGPQDLALALDRAGVDVVVDRSLKYRYGFFRAEPQRAVVEIRMVTKETEPHGDGWKRIASIDPTSRAKRAERARLRREIEERAGAGTSLSDLQAKMAEDPELRRIVDRYNAIDELPELVLVERDLPSP